MVFTEELTWGDLFGLIQFLVTVFVIYVAYQEGEKKGELKRVHRMPTNKRARGKRRRVNHHDYRR